MFLSLYGPDGLRGEGNRSVIVTDAKEPETMDPLLQFLLIMAIIIAGHAR